MKKKLIMGIVSIIFMYVIYVNVLHYLSNTTHSELLSNLEGTVYYTERVDGVHTLFKSDAALQNKMLIYSNKGKGKTGLGDDNDNIVDFYYDKASQTIYFIAMNNGNWRLFSLKEGDNKPIVHSLEDEESKSFFHQKMIMMTKTDYIQDQFKNLTATSKEGSLYLLKNGSEKIIKKFYGMDGKLTGNNPIGFSPDGKYLVYHSMEYLTPFGYLHEDFAKDSTTHGHTYIMDLSTRKSAKFVNGQKIQWVMD